MSLLIKALANAEKDKQAGLSKKQGRAEKADVASSLELAPIEEVSPQQTQSATSDEQEKVPTKADARADLSLSNESFADNSLSLAVEAGLVAPGVVEQKAAETAAASQAQVQLQTAKPQAVKHGKPVASASAGVLAGAAITQPASPAVANQNAPRQKVAAGVFVANQATKPASSKSALILLGVAGALMIWLGIEGSRYITELTKPDVVVVKPAPLAPQLAEQVVADNESAVMEQSPVSNEPSASSSATAFNTAGNDAAAVSVGDKKPVTEKHAEPTEGVSAAVDTQSAVTSRSPVSRNAVSGDSASNHSVNVDSAKAVPMQVSSRVPAAGIDPTLLSAYQAFSRGEDASAQQQYRQVLQRDVRNVDALLGMAAIAQRQGRDADAMGWYQKVLEIEPKNTIAQSAVVSPQANGDVVGTESRIKNLLVHQPEASHLHAALGNVYAEQGQWASAQEAYFNASRFAPNSADYAFNLAISLDQLGKSGLALMQYQRALALLNSSGAATPDRAQLEARIQALQASN